MLEASCLVAASNDTRIESRFAGRLETPRVWLSSNGKTTVCGTENVGSIPISHPIFFFKEDAANATVFLGAEVFQ